MPFLDAVIDEALRLYPPVWALSRRAEEPDVLGDVEIPKGSVVFLSPWVVQRNPKVWRDPDLFDPDRMTSSVERRATFLPFSMGPRKCIGEAFARMEAKIVLATLLQRLHISLVQPSLPTPLPQMTLRPAGGLPVVVRSRKRSSVAAA
jgi:cytochrome P450